MKLPSRSTPRHTVQRTAVVAALAVMLSACSVLEEDKIDYKSAAKAPSLEVPPDLSQLRKDSRYAIESNSATASGFNNASARVADAGTAANSLGDVRMERQGNQRWLVVARPADKVWEPLKEFWTSNGFTLTTDSADVGIMETDWAENRAKIPQDMIRKTLGKVLDSLYSTGERDRFRTRVERNAQGGVDIYITHRGMIENYASAEKDRTIWQPRPSDESSKDAAVRLVFEPKTSRIEQQELITALLAHTSLETSAPINMTSVGIDGKPVQKSLRQMLVEWISFRQTTITRRSQHRLNKVLDRIHILEGRQLVLLNIDEVIRIIRHSDEPKPALIEAFKLSDRQAEDILEIRLRQLARLEAIKIEQELSELREEQGKLEEILGSPAALRRLMIKEIEADAKTFADPRRTLIQEEKKAVAEVKVVDEPVTVVVSEKGWVRARTGHGHDATSFAFKAGDGLYGTFECRTVDTLLIFGSNGRIYSVAVATLPGARGDGQPVTTLIELEPTTQIAHYFAGPSHATLLLSGSGGYGFLASVDNMVSRNKAGKAFISLGDGETVCAPSHVSGSSATVPADKQPMPAATSVCCASTGGRVLTFDIGELKTMEKGGRGLMLIDLEAKDSLAGAAAYTRSVKIEGIGRGGKERDETLEIRSLNNAKATRAKKGRVADLGFKPHRVLRGE